ncbi:hypothetical protein MOQ72_16195 [Saccharopolyspora sp. K220]|uniref:hypothetical protein n=1 Tax=Saccharopolyspora soli TaxID=2926618 RepID=UPI001F56FC00|nr:hypothetical protein [Saccharopolyspora soli]MCI2418986.1 hypothetical protein [Saccharopolyspora soli]
MRRAVTYVGVWFAATTAAVTLSWLGVRDVIRGAVLDQSDSVPVVRPITSAPAESPSPPPAASPAPPPAESPPVLPPQPGTMAPPTSEETQPTPKPSPSPTEDASDVRTYEVEGGAVVLSVRPDRAELISATPRSGYTVQTWDQQDGWLRVEFTAGQHGSSVIATWHDGPTRVQTQEY